MQKNIMKSFARSMKRTSCMLGTRRHLKRYKSNSQVHIYTACAQFHCVVVKRMMEQQ